MRDDYSPWSQYHTEREDIVPLYHPYQIFQIDSIEQSFTVSINELDFEQDSNTDFLFMMLKVKVILRKIFGVYFIYPT